MCARKCVNICVKFYEEIREIDRFTFFCCIFTVFFVNSQFFFVFLQFFFTHMQAWLPIFFLSMTYIDPG